jgi:hypothetical protein
MMKAAILAETIPTTREIPCCIADAKAFGRFIHSSMKPAPVTLTQVPNSNAPRQLLQSMAQHHRDSLTFWGPSTPVASGEPIDSVKHSLPNKKPTALKCICADFNVPFYCPVHGRVENPNWPLLKPIASQQ